MYFLVYVISLLSNVAVSTASLLFRLPSNSSMVGVFVLYPRLLVMDLSYSKVLHRHRRRGRAQEMPYNEKLRSYPIYTHSSYLSTYLSIYRLSITGSFTGSIIRSITSINRSYLLLLLLLLILLQSTGIWDNKCHKVVRMRVVELPSPNDQNELEVSCCSKLVNYKLVACAWWFKLLLDCWMIRSKISNIFQKLKIKKSTDIQCKKWFMNNSCLLVAVVVVGSVSVCSVQLSSSGSCCRALLSQSNQKEGL